MISDKYLHKMANEDYPCSYFWLNDKYKNIVIRDVKVVSFKYLYPFIIYELCKRNKIDLDKKMITKLNLLLNKDNKTDDDRIFINSFYSILKKNDRYKVTSYVKIMYDDLLLNNENIVYIDTDEIFYIDYINILDVKLPYKILQFDYIIFKNIRWYLIYNDGKFKDGNKYKNDLMSMIKCEVIDDNIKKILIDG